MNASMKATAAAAVVLIASTGATLADDEIQVYNAQIAAVDVICQHCEEEQADDKPVAAA